jgi:hypothetical protein
MVEKSAFLGYDAVSLGNRFSDVSKALEDEGTTLF